MLLTTCQNISRDMQSLAVNGVPHFSFKIKMFQFRNLRRKSVSLEVIDYWLDSWLWCCVSWTLCSTVWLVCCMVCYSILTHIH